MFRSRMAAGSRLASAVALVALGIASSVASSVASADAPGGDVAATTSPAPTPSDAASGGPPPHIGYGAMPGGLHIATAETLPEGTVELAVLSGLGYRKGLLAADHTFARALGDVAVAYAPLPGLAIGLSLDGRYDKHKGFAAMSDDGYVGDPHGLVRLGRSFGRVALAGQLGIWVPGKDAPSVVASAISFDARGLLSFDAGFGTLSLDAGVRLDNSANSVDHPERLSAEDRVSLGVSDWSAAIGGISLRVPLGGRAYASVEASTDVFVGSGAPGPILRGGAEVGIAINDTFTVVGFVEAAKVPGLAYSDVMAGNVVLVPFEPSVTGGLGLQARFGRSGAAGAGSHIVENATPVPVEGVETADVSGIVLDDAGKPVAGARVMVKLKNHTGTAVTDGKGAYTVGRLPIGRTIDGKTLLDDTGAEIAVEVGKKKSGSVTLTLGKGANAAPRIALEPMLPPGQLRAVIISIETSRPVAGASVTIDPGGVTATSGPDGKFTVDLPPGHYKLTVTARGLAQQQLDVSIEQNGVAIKNIELHR